MIIFAIWGIMIFINAPELALKIIVCVGVVVIIIRKIISRYNSIVDKRKAQKFKEYEDHMIRSNVETGALLMKQFNVPITKTINYAHERYVFISEIESLIMVDGVVFGFDQLLSCELEDEKRSFNTTTTKEEKQRSSYLDWVINTDVGRVVDAINAPVIRSVNSTSRTIHDYTLKLTLNSLTTPYILIRLGDDENTKNYLQGLFNVIIRRVKDERAKERGN